MTGGAAIAIGRRQSRTRGVGRPASWRRGLKFTRDGKYFVALTFAVGFAAINTGNNLLYLILSLQLITIIASGVLSELNLRHLCVELDLPSAVYAGEGCLIGFWLRTRRARLPSYAVELRLLLLPGVAAGEGWALKVAPGERRRVASRNLFPYRGRYQLRGLEVVTRYPFAFFRKSRTLGIDAELVVFPAPLMAPVREPSRLSGWQSDRGRLARRGEFRSLRDARLGDDVRDIYWRKSARLGRAVVRENEAATAQPVAIILDNRQLSPTVSAVAPANGWQGAERASRAPGADQRCEAAVGRAAYVALHHLEEGQPVALFTRTTSVPPGVGAAHARRVLTALALLEFLPVAEGEPPFWGPANWRGTRHHLRPEPVVEGAPPPTVDAR